MKRMILSKHAPKPMGPYSQAIAAGNFVFVSAHLGADPSTNTINMDDIVAETKQVMENIKAILTEAGAGFSDIVKSSIFLKDMHNYEKVNAVYASYFNEPFPARETIQVAGLPRDVNIEISVIAMMA